MADKCEDLMGKYESMLRRTTQVEMSVGILRSRFETYPPQQFDLTVLEEDVEEEERLVAEAQETAKAWVDSLVGDVDIAPK